MPSQPLADRSRQQTDPERQWKAEPNAGSRGWILGNRWVAAIIIINVIVVVVIVIYIGIHLLFFSFFICDN